MSHAIPFLCVPLVVEARKHRTMTTKILLLVVAMFGLASPLRTAILAQSAQTRGGATVRLSVIRVDTQADAEAVLAQLKAGVAFAVLAQQISTGPNKSQGGSLGEWNRRGRSRAADSPAAWTG